MTAPVRPTARSRSRPVRPASDPRSRYTWDRASARYRAASGRYVGAQDVRHALDEAIVSANDRITLLSERLRTRKISVDEWQLGMRQAVKETQLYGAASARGGWAQMSPADYGAVGRRVRDQYAYLDRFAADIRAGLPTDGQFLSRARMYGASARVSMEAVVRDEAILRGATEGRSVLHVAEHCAQCVDEAAAGFRPVDEVAPIGSRTCGVYDRCTMEYR
ncbi:MAG: hypothetical protein ACR2KM_04130 [Gemmatimonadaceae bacterium]